MSDQIITSNQRNENNESNDNMKGTRTLSLDEMEIQQQQIIYQSRITTPKSRNHKPMHQEEQHCKQQQHQQTAGTTSSITQAKNKLPAINTNLSLELNDIFRQKTSHEDDNHHHSNFKIKTGQLPSRADSKSLSRTRYFDDEFGKSTLTTGLSAKSSTNLNPKFNPILTLFVGLILCTTLALVSAFDAAMHCTQGTYVWFGSYDGSDSDQNDARRWLNSRSSSSIFSSLSQYSLRRVEEGEYYRYDQENNGNDINDGYNNYGYGYQDDDDKDEMGWFEQAQKCKILFADVLTPVCLLVITACILGWRWILKDDTERKLLDKTTIPPCIELTGEDSRDRKRYEEFKAYVVNQKQHLRSCYELLSLSFVCFASWAYGMYMLSADSDETVENNGDEDRNLFKFRHQSLGAFNFLGEVGQNANLYYSSWISLILTIGTVYELTRITFKQHVSTKNLTSELETISKHMVSYTKEIEMVMTWSKAQQHMVKVRRSTWHESLHKLRFRAGFWLVVLIASVVVYCSSSRIWVNYIYPMAQANGEDDLCTILNGLKARDDTGLLYPNKCQRTITSRATGLICVVLSLAALAAHYHFYRLIGKEMEASSIILGQKENTAQLLERRKKLIPLRMEFGFAVALTILLAYNAIFVTAVEGPGSRVGNLYYSSWISFVMSMLIMLGCLEDILDQEDEQDLHHMDGSDSFDRRNLSRWLSVRPINDNISTRLIMLPSSHDSSESGGDVKIGSFIGGMPIPTPNSFHQILEERFVKKEEDSRSTRLRRWASSCIFATIYLISVLDAAFHISYGELDFVQLCMVICPCIMVAFCFIMTCLCVMDYQIVDNIFVGGFVSVFLMILWVGCLILTLHKESSWAINEIEQIENANIYYFTWATVFNTGMLSSSYVKPLMKQHFNMKPKGLMVVLWLGVAKICFVMFGSCADILISERSLCEVAEEGDNTDIFCKRTEMGAIFGFLGMAAGFIAALNRFFKPNPSINGLIGEALMSTILAIMFAFSLGMVTGIGGPGQAVGDLYYGSWLAFFAVIGVAGSLYAEVLKQTKKENELYVSDDSSNSTPYSFWESGNNESKLLT